MTSIPVVRLKRGVTRTRMCLRRLPNARRRHTTWKRFLQTFWTRLEVPSAMKAKHGDTKRVRREERRKSFVGWRLLMEGKVRSTFDIFTTAGGTGRNVGGVKKIHDR